MDTIIAIKSPEYNPALFRALIKFIESCYGEFKVSVNPNQLYFFKGVDKNEIQDEEFLFFIYVNTNLELFAWMDLMASTKDELLEIGLDWCTTLNINTFTIGTPMPLMAIADDDYCELMRTFLKGYLNPYVSSIELNFDTLKKALNFTTSIPYDKDWELPF